METMNMDKEQTHWPAGYRINARMERLPTDIVAAFRNMPVVAIGDAMSRNVGSIGLRQYHRRLEAVLCGTAVTVRVRPRSEEHTSELQSLMRISYAVFCLKKKNKTRNKY